MQKNDLCPLSKKILTYEDSISQSTFELNKLPFAPSEVTTKQIKKKFISNISSKVNSINNNGNKSNHQNIHPNNSNKKKDKKNPLYIFIKEKEKLIRDKYNDSYESSHYAFIINYIIKYNHFEYIKTFYPYRIFATKIRERAAYYYHHIIFLERPYFNDIYFNKLMKKLGEKKVNVHIYQNQKKKELKIGQINNNEMENEIETKKIFDTNVLETIENYSTTMTQEPNNEKCAALTPFEIFKRCEDSKNKKISQKNNDQKSVITFSESEISYKSKNIEDESMLSVVKDLDNKKNKLKIFKQEKKYTNYYIKKKDIQKFERNNKNNANKNNNKIKDAFNAFNAFNNNNKNNKNNEIINKKKVSTSTNKKRKKIKFDNIYQNTISKCTSNRTSFINNAPQNTLEDNIKTNFKSFGTSIRKKNKGVLNLKKARNIKNYTTKFSDNYLMNENSSLITNINSINNINSNTHSTHSKIVSSSFNNNDKLFSYFFTPKNRNINNNLSKSKCQGFTFYNIKKRHIKKNTTLNIVNTNFMNNNNSKNSLEKYGDVKKSSNFKSKSPLTRLFLKKNEYSSNSIKNNMNKNKNSILICELEQNSQITKSENKFLPNKNNKNRRDKKMVKTNKNISSNNIYNNIAINNSNHLNIMTLSHIIGGNMRNSYKFTKLKNLCSSSKI
jgi:hypothetical protein